MTEIIAKPLAGFPADPDSKPLIGPERSAVSDQAYVPGVYVPYDPAVASPETARLSPEPAIRPSINVPVLPPGTYIPYDPTKQYRPMPAPRRRDRSRRYHRYPTGLPEVEAVPIYNEVTGKLEYPSMPAPPESKVPAPVSIIGKATLALNAINEYGVYEATARVLDKVVPRRPFSKAVVAACLLGMFAGQAKIIDETSSYLLKSSAEHYEVNAPSFNLLGPELPQDISRMAIFFPGFGDIHGESEARVIREKGKIDSDIPIGFMDYSNEGASIKQMADAFRAKVPVEKVKSLTLICRSMGGIFAIAFALEVGIPVENITFIASPYEMADGDYGTAGQVMAQLPYEPMLAGSVKFAVSTWRDMIENPQTNPMHDATKLTGDLLKVYGNQNDFDAVVNDVVKGLDDFALNIGHGWHDTSTGGSTEALHKELRVAGQNALPLTSDEVTQADIDNFLRVFDPERTHVLYTATEHPATDQTVKVIQSAYHYRNLFLNILHFNPDLFQIMGLPYDGHADMLATMAAAPVQSYFKKTTNSPLRVLASK